VLMLPDPLMVMVVLTVVVACAPPHSNESNIRPQRMVLDPPAAVRCNCLRIY
jgi:hypothetical protein